ncbi:BNR repeat domain protein [Actinokineospora spheciospongiae]|uniref:BNR repeat domain protein n=1 Tax=Actinokineospora spheciospongiae TaxID=909613 RepID=W7IT45_9PSEU|nr:hypothetical protein [Actinokineospora spheciospongiae]EWC59571.1 BNR repeat domain protein [Actinokineospora spheciospongiae]
MKSTTGLFGLRAKALAVAAGVITSVVLTPGVAHAYTGQVIGWTSPADPVRNVPTSLSSGATAIAVGGGHALAVKNGGVIAWGHNAYGQTGVPAVATSGVTAVAAGASHSLALKNGGVIAWGDNTSGGATVPAAATSGVVAIGAGWSFSVALKSTGTVVAWGNVPAGLNGATGIKAISVNVLDAILVRNDNSLAQYTLVNYTPAPPNTAGLPVKQVAAGVSVHIGLTNDGHTFAWDTEGEPVDLPASMQSGVKSVAASWTHLLTVGNDGAVRVVWLYDYSLVTLPSSFTSGVDKALLGVDSNNETWVVATK